MGKTLWCQKLQIYELFYLGFCWTNLWRSGCFPLVKAKCSLIAKLILSSITLLILASSFFAGLINLTWGLLANYPWGLLMWRRNCFLHWFLWGLEFRCFFLICLPAVLIFFFCIGKKLNLRLLYFEICESEPYINDGILRISLYCKFLMIAVPGWRLLVRWHETLSTK